MFKGSAASAVASAPLSVKISARCLATVAVFMCTLYTETLKMSTKLGVVFLQQISAVLLVYDQSYISHAFADAVYETLLISALT